MPQTPTALNNKKYLGHSKIRQLEHYVGINVTFRGVISNVKTVRHNMVQIVLQPCIINEKITIDHVNVFVKGTPNEKIIGLTFTGNSTITKYKQYSTLTNTYYYNYGLQNIPSFQYERFVRSIVAPNSMKAKIDRVLLEYEKTPDDLEKIIMNIFAVSKKRAGFLQSYILYSEKKIFRKAHKKHLRTCRKLSK
ncbi:hypothetical protein [Lactococcus lactis]|uniref:hypothetical protein n=1 Tax=Lactococcus lactis TaxID=1358 RepID=UPI0028900D9C|nr:hypothetical protein [Lactococcus lactis]MDT2914551.1 hypothetical protein [Lactococcus lactis]MDT2938687.1 hypothetical protein [Lactococcus lactis]